MPDQEPPSTNVRHRRLTRVQNDELKVAASEHGYHLIDGETDGWRYFTAETAPGQIALAMSDDHWFVSVEHSGAAAQLEAERVGPPAGNCRAAFAFAEPEEMQTALGRIFHLSRSLPTYPLDRFEEEVAALEATEAERIVRQRIGEDVFRRAQIEYWDGKCPLTGMDRPELLHASHIKPWVACEDDRERLDIHNGILLAAHWSAGLGAGLVSFDDDGCVLLSRQLGGKARELLSSERVAPLPLTDGHCRKLAWHREHVFRD
jgi:hypothetical protein